MCALLLTRDEGGKKEGVGEAKGGINAYIHPSIAGLQINTHPPPSPV